MSAAKPVIGQRAIETAVLVKELRAVQVGATITYRALSMACGVDVLARRHLLDSARRIAMREHRVVFSAEISTGLRRLSDVETVTLMPELRRSRIRSQAKMGIREIATVDYGKLPADKQLAHNVGLAVLGALHMASDRATVRQIEHQVANGKLPEMDGTLKLIGWVSEK